MVQKLKRPHVTWERKPVGTDKSISSHSSGGSPGRDFSYRSRLPGSSSLLNYTLKFTDVSPWLFAPKT